MVHPTHNTMKTLLVAIGLIALAGTVHAQDKEKMAPKPTTAAAAHPTHNCMTADAKTWESLKLTPEQMNKVKTIQAQCMKECGPMMKTDPKMAMTMDKHEAQVKAVLTPAQYDAWMKWCAAQAAAPEMKKSGK